ncbi:MAG TPA: hypothetical protein VFB06_31080 [Streptosporangiaceae bacterium]|nr:hypothetical protein [Streptosporangiaceae bacterium]
MIASRTMPTVAGLPVPLAGDGLPVRCLDGTERPYLSFDAAASTGALPAVPYRQDRLTGDYLPDASAVSASLREEPGP